MLDDIADIPEIAYTIRYPELRMGENRWGIRTSGIFHQYDEATGKSVGILFSPTPDLATYSKLRSFLNRTHEEAAQHPLHIHSEFIGIYSPNWRQYMCSMEGRLLPLVGPTFKPLSGYATNIV
ncbi:hypothetical protein, partial [Erythrobacter sp. YJ-T3-07]|uniref:hypothetical protein n=1 Tax=Erythrobacter sp. YJ-T3-07 TaxID=2793063 RepID=UPI001F316578